MRKPFPVGWVLSGLVALLMLCITSVHIFGDARLAAFQECARHGIGREARETRVACAEAVFGVAE